ncbi:urate hydroxylase PuuD [uncultured Salinisphaera sp.]|uniref:urate hydroxylase PuuD n=1 Tax=uncultured Salinisphaera sp. TaxID=359372 RepID=UPI0032B246F0|tara:strand:- start:38 stop:1276 length:1239 start_codon:yes stop_codon:yes gene_type:complete
MQAFLIEFGNMLLRWLHVIAAIAWIGESFYFVMLDNGLKKPAEAEDARRGVAGEMWAVHGGGFYHNQKYASAPAKLPDDLHWSYLKAYTTWLSGFALFALLYLTRPEIYLVDPQSAWTWAAAMTGWQANIAALVFLALGWLVYNELCKRISPTMQRDGVLGVAVALMMVAVAYLATHIFAGRAAFVLVGAVMATAMAANVYFWIIPGQRRMVAAMTRGQAPDPLDGKRGKQRSVHNTYFTLPVVLLMLSNHYAFLYTDPYAWVVIALFIVAGALIRQFFVSMHAGHIRPVFAIVGALFIVAAFALTAPISSLSSAPAGTDRAARSDTGDATAFARVHDIIQQRCSECHAENPSSESFSAAPAGIMLDSDARIRAHRAQIKQAVASGYMPLGNITGITGEERQAIANWREDGS